MYTPGPGETLSNYYVHLKNRQHRQRVNDRLTAAGITPAPAPGGSTSVVPPADAASSASSTAAVASALTGIEADDETKPKP